MADKEANIFVVDVGASTKRVFEKDLNHLDYSMLYVWDKLASIVATGRKTLNAGLIAFRTDETKHPLDEDEGFENIKVLQHIQQVLMPDVRNLKGQIKPSSTDSGDAISALVVAVDMLGKFNPTQKWKRKLFMVTDAWGEWDDGDVEAIAERIKELNIELTILGPPKSAKSEEREQNVSILKNLYELCDGVYGDIDQAVTELSIPRIKVKKSVPLYRGTLNLGDPTQYESAMTIDVERFIKTQIERPPTASSYVLGDSDTKQEPGGPPEEGFSSVKMFRTYKVEDENEPGGKREVTMEDLSKGYEYGRTVVPISASDETVTKLETASSFDILGFVPRENCEHYMNMSRACVTVAQRTNDKAIMALSSFIHTLFETDNYAIARLVSKEGRPPELLMLAPLIEPDFECLVDVVIPFAEDVRPYKFPPLDKIMTLSGKNLTSHRNLPTPDLKSAMASFVDSMDLSEYKEDDEEDPAMEYASMEDTFSPALHRITQAIRERAVDADRPVGQPAEILTKYSRPPASLLEKANKSLHELATAADIKKVPPRSQAKFRGSRHQEQPRSGLDTKELLAHRAKTQGGKIDPSNALPEFKQMLERAESDQAMSSAFEQFFNIVQEWISKSLGDMEYSKAIEGIGTMRQEAVEYEVPALYNKHLRDLKERLFQEKLGGDRREMWWRIRTSRLGLIIKTESQASEINEAEATEFLKSKAQS